MQPGVGPRACRARLNQARHPVPVVCCTDTAVSSVQWARCPLGNFSRWAYLEAQPAGSRCSGPSHENSLGLHYRMGPPCCTKPAPEQVVRGLAKPLCRATNVSPATSQASSLATGSGAVGSGLGRYTELVDLGSHNSHPASGTDCQDHGYRHRGGNSANCNYSRSQGCQQGHRPHSNWRPARYPSPT